MTTGVLSNEVIVTEDSSIWVIGTGDSPDGFIDTGTSPDGAEVAVDSDEESKLTAESHSCSVRQTPAAAISASEAAEPVSTGTKGYQGVGRKRKKKTYRLEMFVCA